MLDNSRKFEIDYLKILQYLSAPTSLSGPVQPPKQGKYCPWDFHKFFLYLFSFSYDFASFLFFLPEFLPLLDEKPLLISSHRHRC